MDRKEALDKMQICQPYKCRGKADLKMTHWLFAKKPSNNLLLRDVQDFLIKLGIKPVMHLLEISIFSLNNDLVTLQTHPCNENSVFPCVVFPTGKNQFSLQGSQLMKTGFSLYGNTTQGKPCCGPVLAL